MERCFGRYVLPAIPFLYVAVSRVGLAFDHSPRVLGVGVVLLLAAGAAESLWVVPHSLSFFNVAVGGPKRGHWHLLNSNIDWGQDLLHLQRWQQAHPEATPLYLATFGNVPPETAGIKSLPIPSDLSELAPGWYAISVNKLHGYDRYGFDSDYQQFIPLEPAARAGYSIHIYHITTDIHGRLNDQSFPRAH